MVEVKVIKTGWGFGQYQIGVHCIELLLILVGCSYFDFDHYSISHGSASKISAVLDLVSIVSHWYQNSPTSSLHAEAMPKCHTLG